ncbi:MAG: C40 family peptidase [Treponema sp.]|nr:C40 family peptidase [Treponema sp.]
MITENFAKRLLIVFAGIFFLCCLKLCAEEIYISPAQAQVEREKFVAAAKQYVGSPYVYGAVGPDSFDCSGLIYYVAHESVGKQLPRTAKAIYSYCKIVPDSNKEIGDLLFFKTTSSGNISHVGIYIGNGQFISAISDGPNTGVIISSLKQDYWKGKYVATGQFLKSGKQKEEFVDEEYIPESNDSSVQASNISFGQKLKNNLYIDTSIFVDWSVFSPSSFMISFRGVDAQFHLRYAAAKLQPGFGFFLRFNRGMGLFQIPMIFSTSVNDYFRAYFGPVFSFSQGTLLDTEKTVKASVFPGILGFAVSTPAIKIKEVGIQFVQDISYSTFNNTDDSALNFVESISSGLLFNSGIRITIPASIFKKSQKVNDKKEVKKDA